MEPRQNQNASPFAEAAFRQLAAARLHAEPSEAVFDPRSGRTWGRVLLTLRTDTLPTHAGQIAFPGGKLEAGEKAVDAALRESEEEISLERAHVDVVGFLDSYRTGTGFMVVPVVAIIRPGFVLRNDTTEVAETFEVPLRFLMDEANHQKHAREWRGRQRFYYAMPYGGRYIWGATAAIIKNMHERLFAR
jgi:8-oxo-dGTP pyrophosphatase MutT (NUDIX family)